MTKVTDLLRVAGVIDLSTTYTTSQSYDAPTATNIDQIIADIEAQNTFERLCYFQNFNATHTNEDEQETIFDDCDLGSIVSSRLTPNFNFDLFGVNNIANMARILGIPQQNVAGVLVAGATQDVVNPAAFLQFIKIANQNFDLSTVVVNSVTGSIDGALVLGTDYDVILNAAGETGIQLISGGAITTLTQTFTINYDYTPAAASNLGYDSQARSKAFQLLRFTSCEDFFDDAGVAKKKVNTLYVVRAYLNSDYVEPFTNLANGEIQSASLTFTGDKGSIYVHKQEIVNA